METTKTPRRMARPLYVSEGSDPDTTRAVDASPTTPAEKRVTKQSLVIELLQRAGGASLAAIVEATDWLPHTARATLSGLRKKGYTIVRSSVGGETCYTIAPAAAV